MKEQDQEIDMETDELSKDGDIEYQRRIELETQAKETCLIKSNFRIIQNFRTDCEIPERVRAYLYLGVRACIFVFIARIHTF